MEHSNSIIGARINHTSRLPDHLTPRKPHLVSGGFLHPCRLHPPKVPRFGSKIPIPRPFFPPQFVIADKLWKKSKKQKNALEILRNYVTISLCNYFPLIIEY